MRTQGLAAALLLLGSCATSRWDRYDESAYEVVMEPSDEAVQEHIELLSAWSTDAENPAPPGLFAELGYWLAKVGRYEEAQAAFDEEVARYPYAATYLATLRSLVIATTQTEESPAPPSEAPQARPGG